ncbi:enoyl-CoA hydratase/isomerase family protein [Halalkalibacterium halodurans]|jgi:2-(1,2-epoxy-1,2-dihydrophenyl)acetyl-CoA isomerase|uniref:Enoyl-CoA hydratase n=2 Tax=Halalkalibacterium halodurans TaxID=86665 RepID=Q9K6A5_HALH5|nr:enoyl-CoA hydratase/isomerase family protein [Halalkalibacterium halodurans]MDY7224328.1 enoyl-CoA hydratase/isomerase family protein [Halalkalibacterium halodurans]MDY7243613.1 enoyl-CoA hydratase/isomerase family protein [Halalkalibacterium halodurans]MED3648810.1 enoyl-CoA hydratase/isomerase family protein [Halalkalibacterium halodurans]MED4079533.1 enoyl-CoA hydratase/isomerase family protein [Halalkalibacterium halodurans]MED4084190.1 enoyl-CoA hydratase/isomerase family protein [Hala
MTKSSVLYEVTNDVATITLNRPEVKNAINKEMHQELFSAFQQADGDENVKVIVLQGNGDAFCAGADLKSIPLEELEDFDHGTYLRDTYNRLILLIDSIQKPTVAYINGTAVGAGLSIALACDLRVATYNAKLGLGFLKIGLVPDAGASYFLPRLVGYGKALELALGNPISAEEAYRINLIHQIGEPDKLIEQLRHTSITAFGLMKQTFKASFEQTLPSILEQEVFAQSEAGQTREHRQAIQQFLQR